MADILLDVVAQIGNIALWLKAIGGIVILWILFQTIAFYYNRRRFKELAIIKNDMMRIESKIDKLLKKI